MTLVGRDAETADLLRQIQAAIDGSSGRALFIEGATGVGKSALVSEVLQKLARDRPEIALARGRCQQVFGSGDPYLPFVEALRDLADGEAAGAATRETVTELLAELAPYWLAVIPLVGSFLSAGLQTALRLKGRPETAPTQKALFLQYLRVIEQLAQQGPLVLFIDDLHRADPGSVALLSHLCRGIAHLPVVVIGALRPNEAGEEPHPIRDTILELERERIAYRVLLEELRGGELQALIEAELGGAAAVPLRDRIIQTAGGNPLFVTELCRLLRRDGTAVLEDGAWHLAEGTGVLDIPHSAEVALGKRVERLDPESLRVLHYASVQGSEFSSLVLARLLEVEELALLDRLEELARREGLVRPVAEIPVPGGEVATIFRLASPLLHTVLYRQVMGKRRVLLHRRTGEILEAVFQSALPLVASELAWHFREGRVPEPAARYAGFAEATARSIHVGWSPETGTRPAAASPAAPDPSDPPPQTQTGAAPSERSAFVGREEELDLLAREIALAVELRAGRTVFIQGPPGAGKTTLVAELLGRVAAARPELTIARGRCLPTLGSADPYIPFVEALRDISDEKTLGFTEKESFATLLADIAPIWISTVPVVGNLLSATLTTATVLRGKPKENVGGSREALFIEYVELLRRLAERSPLVLFFDDLHWADQSSVALLAHIARAIERLPIVLIGTLRDDEATREHPALARAMAELEGEELARRIELEEMRGDVLDALLAAEFGGDVSEPLRRWVVDTAGGNPLFASELCRLLRQSGAAVAVKGEWLLTDRIRELGIPRSAEAVIEKRIQRLDASSLRALQYASVEGNEFNSVILAKLLDEDELRVLERMERLAAHDQLVRFAGEVRLSDGETATAVQFRHALIQTVLYRQLAGKRRIILHRRAGEILESLFHEQQDAIAGKLARHFHHGSVDGPAYRYARMAADAARRAFAQWEAEELYRIALEHAPDEPTTAQVEESLGDVYDVVGYYPQGIAAYERALAKYDDRGIEIRLRRKILGLEQKAGLAPAPVLLERIRELLNQAREWPREHCQLLLELFHLPNSEEMGSAAAEALRLAEIDGDRVMLAIALEQYARVLILTGRPEESLAYLERALVASGVDDPVRSARNHNLAGIAHAKLGRYSSARAHFEQMLEIAERIGHPNGIGSACGCLGRLLIRFGSFREAEDLLQRARVIYERRSRSGIVHPLFNLAERALSAGEVDVALERYEQLRREAVELGHWSFEALAHAGMGLCLLAKGRDREADRQAEIATSRIAGREGWFENRELLELFLARIEAVRSRASAAERLARAARALEHVDVYIWARIELERVHILQRVDLPAAQKLLEHVARSATTIEAPPLHAEIAETRRLLAATPSLRRPVVR